jgi:glycosyl hydrolase family 64 (putative beta-1,3-glucanase)
MIGTSRRAFLRSLTAAVAAGPAVLAACGGPPAGSPAAPVNRAPGRPVAAGQVRLTVLNDTRRFRDDEVWIHVVGTELASGQQMWLTREGEARPIALDDNAGAGPAAYGTRLSELPVVPLPRMSGRVYVSIGGPIPFRVVGTPGGVGLQHPAGWVESDPSYRLLHDFAELTNGDAGLWCNTSMVDMFSIPLQFEVEGTSTRTAGAVTEGGRARAFAALAALPGWSGLVVDDLRVIAPGHGVDAGRFAPDYLDAYIAACWDRYQARDLVVATDAGTVVGRAEGPDGPLAFRRDGAVVTRIARPTTRDVLYCDGALAAPNDGVTGPIAAVLGAALNRSTLLDHPDQPTTDPSTFHPSGVTTNDYVRIVHEITADGRAYGFAFDDVAERAPLVHDPAPSSLTLTLTPF